MARRLLILLAACVAAAFLALSVARDHLHAASMVVAAADLDHWWSRPLEWQRRPVSLESLSIPTRHGSVRARMYRTPRRPSRTLLLIPGVHATGIDEPRLVGFARDLAAEGLTIVTPELPGLKQYRITA